MGNVVEIGRSCAYLVSRASRHRRLGRYDEAMMLLAKAKDQFGLDEEIELEMARVYEEIGCDEEAARSYLRIARIEGVHQALAWFQLALLAFQRSDIRRAASYYQQFIGCPQGEVSAESAAELENQLRKEQKRICPVSKKGRARMLRRRAAICIQEGKTVSARRMLMHALTLHPTAQGYMLLACCCLLRQEIDDALSYAKRSHQIVPARVQPLCILSDAYAAAGDLKNAKKYLYIASMRAVEPDDLHVAALNSAKYGMDHMTLRLTARLLKREPFHSQGMMIRACALANLGRIQEASRLWGRLCGLLPEDSVSESYFRMCKENRMSMDRLDLGADVTRQEGIERASWMISLLYEDPLDIANDKAKLRRVCRYCAWALHSPLIGTNISTVALLLLGALPSNEAKEILLDVLTDPQKEDSMKLTVLQLLASQGEFKPCFADLDARLVRLAAGAVCDHPVSSKANSKILQNACDVLSVDYADAPQVLMPIYLEYLHLYPEPEKRRAAACSAALVYLYHQVRATHEVEIDVFARRFGVSKRLCRVMANRLSKAAGHNRQKQYKMEE